MRALIVSKALVVASYRQKLEELSRLGVEMTAVVPPEWREGGGVQRLEPSSSSSFELIVSPIRFNGHFHLHYYPELGRIIRSVVPEILHIDEEPYNLATFLASRDARRAAVPSLFFTWQNINRRYPVPFSLAERRVYEWSAHALAGNQDAERILREKRFAHPITVVPQFGVDPHVFSPGPRHPGPFTIGFLNRLVPEKGAMVALEALTMLGNDPRLLIVGDGPIRDEVLEDVRARGLQSRVTLRRRVPSAEMPDLIRGLDAVVLPSLTTPAWKEQFGRILIESMSCGVPVVGSDSGEIPNVIGDAGIVVPEGDARLLADALARLQTDSSLREDLARRGRERVIGHFTHAHIARLTHRAYQSALAAR